MDSLLANGCFDLGTDMRKDKRDGGHGALVWFSKPKLASLMKFCSSENVRTLMGVSIMCDLSPCIHWLESSMLSSAFIGDGVLIDDFYQALNGFFRWWKLMD